ncbi:unnamed protein product [Vitrella brassicaformis CCMP3155]|uniref:SSD domain-containing protein n=1 Tax=Vitrella brassicaformis (strain CCMP3155) TaxID=1169540 RepID=A0A0G4EJQ6_VITBC|nr:unnamed protein product [Vitrella brassicaformis CCMP3155]|eukprot:CEL96744.1 unnamed protein product [Vitrella brassicaformis CCMP3155]
MFATWKGRFVGRIERFFYNYTCFVYRHPWKFIWVTLLLSLSVGTLTFFRQKEFDTEINFAMPDSKAVKARELYEKHFGQWPRDAAVVASAVDPDDNLLTKEHLDELRALTDDIANVTVKVDGRSWRFEDICARDGTGECDMATVFMVYGEDSEDRYGTPLNYPRHPSIRHGGLFPWPVAFLMGNITVEDVNGRQKATRASSFIFRWAVTPDAAPKAAILQWEKAFLHKVMDWTPEFRDKHGIELLRYARRTPEDELANSFYPLMEFLIRMGCCGLVVGIYCVVANLSGFGNGHKSKLVPAIMGLVSAVLGSFLGFGIVYSAGFKHVVTMEVTPYLCMGIGVNDLLVILNAYAPASQIEADPMKKCARTMKDSGLAITITTLANVIAFGIGASTGYTAVVNFCVLTAVALGFVYIYALTFFLPFLCLDARREACSPPSYLKGYFGVGRGGTAKGDATPSTNIMSGDSSKPEVSPPASTQAFSPQPEGDRDIAFPTIETIDLGPSGDYDVEEAGKTTTLTPIREEEEASDAAEAVTEISAVASGVHELVALQVLQQEDRIQQKLRQRRQRRQPAAGSAATHEANHAPDVEAQAPRQESEADSKTAGPPCSGFFSVQLAKPADSSPVSVDVEEPRGLHGKWMRLYFRRFWGRWLTIPAVKVFVVALWLTYVGLCGFSASKLRVEFEVSNTAPYGSYFIDFLGGVDEAFGGFNLPGVLLYSEKQHWWTKATREAFMEFEDELTRVEGVHPETQSGLYRFYEFYSRTPELLQELNEMENDPKAFSDKLRQWMNRTMITSTPFKLFKTDFNFNDDGELEAYKTKFFMRAYSDPPLGGAPLMQRIRDKCDRVKRDHGITVATFTDAFVYYESDLILVPQTLVQLSAALVGVLLVSIFLLHGAITCALVLVMLISIDLGVFGFMTVFDLPLNLITSINLVVSIGFSVDFTTHICHAYTLAVGRTPNHRMVETMALMGAPVFSGGMSTFLALTPFLIVQRSYSYDSWCLMMILVVACGVLHALVFLPVILSLLPISKARNRTNSQPNQAPTEARGQAAKGQDNKGAVSLPA